MKKWFLFLLAIFFFSSASAQTAKSRYFRLEFNKHSGTVSAVNAGGELLFKGAVNAIVTEGNVYYSGQGNYRYQTRSTSDRKGNPLLVIEGIDKSGRLHFTQQITLFNNIPAVGFEVKYRNASKKEIKVMSLEPLRLIAENGGALFYNHATHCITNGAMYYDAGAIHELGKPWTKPEPYGETKGGVMSDFQLLKNPLTAQSWWNIAVTGSVASRAINAGYLLNANTLGRLQLLKTDEQQLSLVAESVLNPGFMLKPGKEISSDQFVLVEGSDVYEACESYAGLMKEKMNQPECSIVNGWCNWFYTMDVYTENEILENAVFAASHLKPYGLEYIQIDEGFQTAHGNWKGNVRFPHGLKWLCDSIKKLGLKPGLWIAPFVISENTEIYNQHPDWLLKDEKGEPVRIGPWPSENTEWFRNETPKRYCLDITHPEAEKWYTALIDTIANRWGFEMIKVDFVAWTVFSARQFYDRGATPAQVYRRAMEIMRSVAGSKCHLLECGPGHVTGGFINSMRIEYDQNYGSSDNTWTQYFRGNSCSAGAAGKRWFFHNRAWTNDIDHVCIDLLSEEQAKAVATLIGISGGNTMSGDRLVNLNATKLEILKKTIPATPENGIPVDWLENDPQTIFTCHIDRDFEAWDVVAFFNPDLKNQVRKSLSLDQEWLSKEKTYLCFDFWNEKFLGEVRDSVHVTTAPGSVTLLSLREKTGQPQIMGTTRHVKQGAVEIETVSYNPLSRVLSGTSVAPEGSSHSAYIYLPAGFDWIPTDKRIYEFHPGYSIRRTGENVLRLDVRFINSGKAEWQILFEK